MFMGAAIALWRYGYHQADEIFRFLSLSLALMCSIAALVATPWPLKIGVCLGLLVYPTCASTNRVLTTDCPRFCLLRHHCQARR